MASVTVDTIITVDININANIHVISIPKNVLITTMDILITPNIHVISIPKNVLITTMDISISFIDLQFFGGRWDNFIKPYSTRLHLVANYILTPKDMIHYSNSIKLSFILDEFLNTNVTAFAKTTTLTTSVPTFALWELDKKPRVIKIDTIDIQPSMYFSNNRTKIISSSKMYIDGKTKHFSSNVYKYGSVETISTDTDFWIDAVTVKKLYSLLDKEFNIYLSNGEVFSAKFDLTNSPFIANRIYKGGVGFYVTLKVLI